MFANTYVTRILDHYEIYFEQFLTKIFQHSSFIKAEKKRPLK